MHDRERVCVGGELFEAGFGDEGVDEAGDEFEVVVAGSVMLRSRLPRGLLRSGMGDGGVVDEEVIAGHVEEFGESGHSAQIVPKSLHGLAPFLTGQGAVAWGEQRGGERGKAPGSGFPVRLSPPASTINPVNVTLELPAEAQARLEAEASRRGITLDQLVAEFAASFPVEGPKHRLAFVGIGASRRTEPFDIHQERADLAAKKFAEGV